MEKSITLLSTGIKITTRNGDYFFYMFINIDETYKLIEQLTYFAVQNLLSKSEEFKKDVLCTTATTPEEYFEASIVETVRQRAESYKVGAYYVGPIPPTWNADGTPYVAPVVDNDTTPPVEEEV